MKKILMWYGAGILAVTIPFVIWLDPYSLWGSIIAGACGGAIFLFAVVVRMYRSKLFSRFERGIAVVISLLLIIGYMIGTMESFTMASFQSSNLCNLRQMFGGDMIVIDKVYHSMMPVLREFHRPDAPHRSLVDVFRGYYGTSLRDGSFNKQKPKPEFGFTTMDAITIVSFSEDSMVHYACVDTFARGLREEFQNATGQRGKIEVHATLTSKGIRYERLN